MRDDDEVFKVRLKDYNLTSEARAILVILGFEGIRDFAKRAGVNHQTVADALGTRVKQKVKNHHYNLVAINEALHTAYIDRKPVLTRATRAYVCDWAKRWHRDAIQNRLHIENPLRRNEVARYSDYSRKYKQEKTKAGVLAAFKSLEWKP